MPVSIEGPQGKGMTIHHILMTCGFCLVGDHYRPVVRTAVNIRLKSANATE
jgi:hypothetical protein